MRTPSPIRPALAIAATAALLAGCGGSSHTPTTSPQANGGIAADAYRYSACMREHGVANFPDPKVSVNGNHGSVMIGGAGIAFGSPRVKSAEQACQGLMPAPAAPSAQQQHARAQALLAFARCMRARGVQRFPDPASNGQLPLSSVTAAGVDLHAPSTLSAGLACASVTHGIITRADVVQAVNRGTQ